MKVLLISSNANQIINNKLNEIFNNLEIEVTEFKIKKSWLSDKFFFNTIFNYDYFLIITNREIYQKKWFKFIIGYCIGKKSSIYLFLIEPFLKIPILFNFVEYSHDLKIIQEFYFSEKKLLIRKDMIENAKQLISKAGYYFTPFHFFQSIHNKDLEIVLLFLQADMSPDNKNEYGVPAFNYAVRLNYNEIAQLLMEHNCNIYEISQDNGNNALMDAAGEKNIDMVRLLIEKNIDLNVKSKNNQTALMLAVGRNAAEIVDLLLEAGADAGIEDVLDMTALHYAEILNYQEIINIFKKYNK